MAFARAVSSAWLTWPMSSLTESAMAGVVGLIAEGLVVAARVVEKLLAALSTVACITFTERGHQYGGYAVASVALIIRTDGFVVLKSCPFITNS
uniref:Putative secreted protein n=1 Tax=Anopheles triannulatus TaxID=58253 RepID=A0A2M4B7J2_9DIPT